MSKRSVSAEPNTKDRDAVPDLEAEDLESLGVPVRTPLRMTMLREQFDALKQQWSRLNNNDGGGGGGGSPAPKPRQPHMPSALRQPTPEQTGGITAATPTAPSSARAASNRSASVPRLRAAPNSAPRTVPLAAVPAASPSTSTPISSVPRADAKPGQAPLSPQPAPTTGAPAAASSHLQPPSSEDPHGVGSLSNKARPRKKRWAPPVWVEAPAQPQQRPADGPSPRAQPINRNHPRKSNAQSNGFVAHSPRGTTPPPPCGPLTTCPPAAAHESAAQPPPRKKKWTAPKWVDPDIPADPADWSRPESKGAPGGGRARGGGRDAPAGAISSAADAASPAAASTPMQPPRHGGAGGRHQLLHSDDAPLPVSAASHAARASDAGKGPSSSAHANGSTSVDGLLPAPRQSGHKPAGRGGYPYVSNSATSLSPVSPEPPSGPPPRHVRPSSRRPSSGDSQGGSPSGSARNSLNGDAYSVEPEPPSVSSSSRPQAGAAHFRQPSPQPPPRRPRTGESSGGGGHPRPLVAHHSEGFLGAHGSPSAAAAFGGGAHVAAGGGGSDAQFRSPPKARASRGPPAWHNPDGTVLEHEQDRGPADAPASAGANEAAAAAAAGGSSPFADAGGRGVTGQEEAGSDSPRAAEGGAHPEVARVIRDRAAMMRKVAALKRAPHAVDHPSAAGRDADLHGDDIQRLAQLAVNPQALGAIPSELRRSRTAGEAEVGPNGVQRPEAGGSAGARPRARWQLPPPPEADDDSHQDPCGHSQQTQQERNGRPSWAEPPAGQDSAPHEQQTSDGALPSGAPNPHASTCPVPAPGGYDDHRAVALYASQQQPQQQQQQPQYRGAAGGGYQPHQQPPQPPQPLTYQAGWGPYSAAVPYISPLPPPMLQRQPPPFASHIEPQQQQHAYAYGGVPAPYHQAPPMHSQAPPPQWGGAEYRGAGGGYDGGPYPPNQYGGPNGNGRGAPPPAQQPWSAPAGLGPPPFNGAVPWHNQQQQQQQYMMAGQQQQQYSPPNQPAQNGFRNRGPSPSEMRGRGQLPNSGPHGMMMGEHGIGPLNGGGANVPEYMRGTPPDRMVEGWQAAPNAAQGGALSGFADVWADRNNARAQEGNPGRRERVADAFEGASLTEVLASSTRKPALPPFMVKKLTGGAPEPVGTV